MLNPVTGLLECTSHDPRLSSAFVDSFFVFPGKLEPVMWTEVGKLANPYLKGLAESLPDIILASKAGTMNKKYAAGWRH